MLKRFYSKQRTISDRSAAANRRKRRENKRRLTFQHVEGRRMFAGLPAGDLGDHIAPDRYDTVATRSGDFSDPRIWTRGVPTDGETFEISRGVEVTVDRRINGRFNFVNIRGTLSFETDTNTRLRAETVRVENRGRLEIGTPQDRINDDVIAELVFTSVRAAGDRPDGFASNDKTRVGLGLLVQPGGQFETAGQQVSAQTTSAARNRIARDSFRANSDRITVLGDASGFDVGDEISIAATRFRRNNANQTETARIRSIRRTGTIEGQQAFEILLGSPRDHRQRYQLTHDHRNIAGNVTNVVNLTRNVVLRSDAAGVRAANFQGRGHVFIQSQDVRILDAEFRDLGRTDNTRLSEDGEDGVRLRAEDGRLTNVVVPQTRDGLVNQRGRNSLKFSRTLDQVDSRGNYVNDGSNLALVRGSVVNDAPGWGFINHSSGVNFVDNIAVGVVGAAFIASAGNEIGSFRNNVALDGDGDGTFFTRRVELAGPALSPAVQTQFRDFTRSRFGRAENITTQELITRHGDHARTGEGFWIQSPGVSVTNNVAAGFDGRGFAIYNQGLFEGDREEEAGFRIDLITWTNDDTYRIWDTGNATNDGRAIVQNIQRNTFDGNTSYANFVGLQTRFVGTDNRVFTVDWDGQFEFSRATDRGRVNLEGFTISDFTGLRNEVGLTTSYITDATFEDVTLLNDGPDDFNFAILAQQVIQGRTRFEELTIEGYRGGIDFNRAQSDFVLVNPDFQLTDNDAAARFVSNTGNPQNQVREFGIGDLDRIRRGVYVDI